MNREWKSDEVFFSIFKNVIFCVSVCELMWATHQGSKLVVPFLWKERESKELGGYCFSMWPGDVQKHRQQDVGLLHEWGTNAVRWFRGMDCASRDIIHRQNLYCDRYIEYQRKDRNIKKCQTESFDHEVLF